MRHETRPGSVDSRRAVFLRSCGLAAPIVLGYIPIGIAYGVLGSQSGLPLWVVVGMSLVVFAGSAQFLAVGMISYGVPWTVIAATTLLVNLRHLLMSTALVPYTKGSSPLTLAAMAFGVTDESFAVNSAKFRTGDHSIQSVLIVSYIGYGAWAAASSLGYLLGNRIANPLQWGLDFALPAMFIGLLFLQLRNRLHYLVLGVSGVLSVLFQLLGMGWGAVLLAAIIGAAGGGWVHSRTNRNEAPKEGRIA